MNSIISWVGGKKALREMIYERMPVSYGRYVEVFGGGGWVLFGKPPETAMEVYNDFNSNLSNLFYCVKNSPLALLKELNFLPLNGRDEFQELKKYLQKEETLAEHLETELVLAEQYFTDLEQKELKEILIGNATSDPVKKAAAFFKLIRYSYGSGCISYSCQPFDIRKTFHLIWSGSMRLKNTVIENKDFEALICHYDRPDAFFYCDPPYYLTEGHYEVEFQRADHKRLREALGNCKGKWLLSYNDCDYIREMYEGYQIESVSRLNNMAQRYEHGAEYAEILVANYDMKERKNSMPKQMRLFDS